MKEKWIGKENGKWFVGDDEWSLDNWDCDSHSHVEVGCGNETVAIIPVTGWQDKKMEARAHLIAQAPAMYEMLKDLSTKLPDELTAEYYEVIGLLAKARGES